MSSNKLPTVTSNIPRDLRMFIDRVREVIGKDLVTKNEVTRLIRDGGGGSGGGGASDPTAPTNLKATGIIGAIELTWDSANYAGHSHTEVWACDSDTRDQAVAVGSSPGTAFGHAVGPLTGKFYWIRHVNTNNVRGPFNAENGTFAKSCADQSGGWTTIIKELDESLLTKLLLEKLDWNQIMAFRQEMNQYLERFTEIEGEYEVITGAPAWEYTKVYAKGSQVSYKGGLYEAKVASGPTTQDMHPAATPARWTQIGSSAQLKASIDDTDNYARVTLTNRVATGEGKVSKISSALVQTKVADLDANGNVVATQAGLGMLSKLDKTANDTTANSALLATVSAILKDDAGNLTANANAVDAIETEVKQARGGLTSLAARFNSLVAEIAGKASAGAFERIRAMVEHPTTGLAAKATVESVRSLYAALGGVLDDPTKPPKTLAMVEEKINVWAATDDAGATYTLKMRAGAGAGAADVGFGMAAVQENGRWVGDVRFNAQRFAIMDPTLPNGRIYPFIVDRGIVYIDRLNVGTMNIARGAISTVYQESATGRSPVINIDLSETGGTITVIVTGNFLAQSGQGPSTIDLFARCGQHSGPEWTGPEVGISMAREMSGSGTAMGNFNVPPGHYWVAVGVNMAGARTLGSLSAVAIVLKR